MNEFITRFYEDIDFFYSVVVLVFAAVWFLFRRY